MRIYCLILSDLLAFIIFSKMFQLVGSSTFFTSENIETNTSIKLNGNIFIHLCKKKKINLVLKLQTNNFLSIITSGFRSKSKNQLKVKISKKQAD